MATAQGPEFIKYAKFEAPILPTIPSPPFIKYDIPILVTEDPENISSFTQEQGEPSTIPRLPFKLIDIEANEIVVDCVLPPRRFEEGNRKWVQHISREPATTTDVIDLEEQLNMRLTQQHAREIGICPVRRELYDLCFDEIMRQVTVCCAERGLLMLTIRNECRMTLSAYERLYKSGMAYAIRKAVKADLHKAKGDELVKTLTSETEHLRQEVKTLEGKKLWLEKESREKYTIDKRYAEQRVFLQQANEKLQTRLRSLATTGSKQ